MNYGGLRVQAWTPGFSNWRDVTDSSSTNQPLCRRPQGGSWSLLPAFCRFHPGSATPSSLFSFQGFLFSLLFFFLFPSPPLPFSVMKVKDGWLLFGKQRCAVRVMNESCPPAESEGTVVHTARYRLMFSYSKVGVSAGWRAWRAGVEVEVGAGGRGRTDDKSRKGTFGGTGLKGEKVDVWELPVNWSAPSKCPNTFQSWLPRPLQSDSFFLSLSWNN